MDFDDKQDENEKRFELARAEYLGGRVFTVYGCFTGSSTCFNLDDLLMKMYEFMSWDDDASESEKQRAIYLFNQAGNLALSAHQKIAAMMLGDNEELKNQASTFLRRTMLSFLYTALANDDDLVDEAVNRIMGGTTEKYLKVL